jgi:hypothetical protein
MMTLQQIAYKSILDNLSPEAFEALPDYVQRAVEEAGLAEIEYRNELTVKT